MNMTLVDLTDVPEASIEDEVVLLGSQGDERLPAEQLAAWCGTIAYEIVARIHPALPRRVV
jgi:alanine racemase